MKSQNANYLTTNKKLEVEVSSLQEKLAKQTTELEKHENEATKQTDHIRKMKEDKQCFIEERLTLKTNLKMLTEDNKSKEQEIGNVRRLLADLEKRHRLETIQNEAIIKERNLGQQNLLKAEEELVQNRKESQSLREKVKTLNFEAENRNKQLTKANLACNDLKEMLEKKTLQLAEAKKMYEDLNRSQAHLLAAARLNEVPAEIAKLEKKILHLENEKEQLQIQVNLQNVKKVSQEKSNRDTSDQVSILQTENDLLKYHLSVLRKGKLRPVVFYRPVVNKHRLNMVQKKLLKNNLSYFQKNILGQKDAEIEDLKCRLARRPDDAMLKFQQCQWDNRQLKKQLQGTQGQILAFESDYEKVSNENKELTMALRKLKCELAEKRVHLPSISTSNQRRTEDKSKDECKREFGEKSVHLSPICTSNQRRTEEQSKDEGRKQYGAKPIMCLPPNSTMAQSSTQDQVTRTPKLAHLSTTEDQSKVACRPVSRQTRFPLNAKSKHGCEKDLKNLPVPVLSKATLCTPRPRPPPATCQVPASPRPRPPPAPASPRPRPPPASASPRPRPPPATCRAPVSPRPRPPPAPASPRPRPPARS
ncbi:uncharacterized protein ACO6RY_14458 [Pungitius sinensis]